MFHRTSNVLVKDSIMADNGIGIDYDKTHTPLMRLNNVTIIGESNSFRTNVLDKNVDRLCQFQPKNIGIEIHTRKQKLGATASAWNGVRFSGFDHSSCSYVSAISLMDDSVSLFLCNEKPECEALTMLQILLPLYLIFFFFIICLYFSAHLMSIFFNSIIGLFGEKIF